MTDKDSKDKETALDKWISSADAWIKDQGAHGDWSRCMVLDPVLERLLPDVNGTHVLDVGCGEGRYSRVLAAKGANVTGVDPVRQFIDLAKSKDTKSIYLQASAEELPHDDEQFDVVLSYLSIIDIPDLEAASREMIRVLKPGGELLIVNISNFASPSEGWVKDETGHKAYRKVDRYMEHFGLDVEWRNIRIRNYHRPLSYVLGLFLSHDFVLHKFEEPLPHPLDSNYASEFRAPNFQAMMLRKP